MAVTLRYGIADEVVTFASFAVMPLDDGRLTDNGFGDRTTYHEGFDEPGVATDPGVNVWARYDLGERLPLLGVFFTGFTQGVGRYDVWWFDDLVAFSAAWTAAYAASGSPFTPFLFEFPTPGLPGGGESGVFASGGWHDVAVYPPAGTVARYAMVRVRAQYPGVPVTFVGRLSDARLNYLPASALGNPMNSFIFSTGILYAFLTLDNAPTITRVSVGSPPAPVQALGNFSDGNPATLGDLTYTNAGNRQYLRLDYGTQKDIQTVLLANALSAAAVLVYASNTAITDGDFTAATAIPLIAGTNPPTSGPLRFEAAAVVPARYVYIVPAAGATIGEVEARGERVNFGCVQGLTFSLGFQEALLRCVTWASQLPVADAQFDADVTFTAQVASFDPLAAEILTGATLVTSGDPDTLTGGITNRPLRFCAEFECRTIEGKQVFITGYDCVAPGFSWQFNRSEFAVNDFTARVYAGETGLLTVPYTIAIEN